jgi:hypothetical protein
MGRRVGRVLLAAMIATAVTVVAMPGTAGADTCCTDGWLSPSEGGSGTCSHHGGIAGADYSYSPNDVTRKACNAALAPEPEPSSEPSNGFHWTGGWTLVADVLGVFGLFSLVGRFSR